MYSPPDRTPAQWELGVSRRSRAPPPGRAWRSGGAPPTPPSGRQRHRAARPVDRRVGQGQTPSRSESLPGGTTRSVYADASRPVRPVEVYSISGMAHGLAVD
ncbi:hypothetical protein LV779_16065 [Streptomyces thinghirensis]|nr:hypothetical protein [Streptomyces thinghirensis]